MWAQLSWVLCPGTHKVDSRACSHLELQVLVQAHVVVDKIQFLRQNSVPRGYRTEASSSQRRSTFPATWPSPWALPMVAACSVKASGRVSVVRGVRWSLTMGVVPVLCCWLEAILRSTYLQGVSRIGFFCSRPLPLACR